MPERLTDAEIDRMRAEADAVLSAMGDDGPGMSVILARHVRTLAAEVRRLRREADPLESEPAVSQGDIAGAFEALRAAGGHAWDDVDDPEAFLGRKPGPSLDDIFHRAWTRAVGTPGYDKATWLAMEKVLREEADHAD